MLCGIGENRSMEKALKEIKIQFIFNKGWKFDSQSNGDDERNFPAVILCFRTANCH